MKLEPPPSAEDETILEYHAKKIRNERDKIEMEVEIRDFLNKSANDRVDKQGNIDRLQAELRAQEERANANLKATLNAALKAEAEIRHAEARAQEERANANLKATLNAALKAKAEIRHAEARAQEERANANLKATLNAALKAEAEIRHAEARAQEERADAKLKAALKAEAETRQAEARAQEERADATLKAAFKAEAETRQAALEALKAKMRAEARAEALARKQEYHRNRLARYKGNLMIRFLDRIQSQNGKDDPKKDQNDFICSSTGYIRQAERLDHKTLKKATGLDSKFLKVIQNLGKYVNDRNVATCETDFEFAQYLVSVRGDGSDHYSIWTPILLYAVQMSSLEEYIADIIDRGRD
ncbi:MAG: hypothetical protein M1825_004306 [Sarcosagium campestre]|nr:MAG: hypothetical protein M1825_004306 [Sarcosagium campestre]